MAIPELANLPIPPSPDPHNRLFPVGAEPFEGGVDFQIWAPECEIVELILPNQNTHPEGVLLDPAGGGYFRTIVANATPGQSYGFRLNGKGPLWPDPASRFQPEGPWELSQIVDTSTFSWNDTRWEGVRGRGEVVYEMHVGTFTGEGTWNAAISHLGDLASLGITVIELMPIADFAGRFGWGYDGANLFAPSHLYGTPDDFRQFVDAAHALGIGVILDVVYNHYSSVGEKLLRPFAKDYFAKEKTDWGAAVNFDGPESLPVRAFFLANVEYWIREFHLDGFRIDATQSIHDSSEPHILFELCRVARQAAPDRQLWILGENEPQQTKLLRSAASGGYELDALWNDDFHHAAMVRLTGQSEAYFTDYRGSAYEFVACVQWGFLYQGQRYSWQKAPRGTPALDCNAWRFVNYLQNHDQLANSATGARLHQRTSPGRYRAMTGFFLLAPQTPLLFQGQEFAASTPFLYFNDCSPEEQPLVAKGRAEFLSQFRSLATEAMQAVLPNPAESETFERSKLDHAEARQHTQALALHRDLLSLRREDPVLNRLDSREIYGGVLSDDVFFLRYLPPTGETRLLIVNFGAAMRLEFIAHPLVAPPLVARWSICWSSEDPAYGGGGTPELDTPEGWRIPAESTVLLCPVSTTS